MGYTTTFKGKFDLDRPLAPEHKAYLDAFAGTRRMKRESAKTEQRPDIVRVFAGLPVGHQALALILLTVIFGVLVFAGIYIGIHVLE